MKIGLQIIELVLYIGFFIFLSIFVYIKGKELNKWKVYALIITINLVGLFPLLAGIDYVLQLNNPFLEVCACIGFTLSGVALYFILPFLLYHLITYIYNKIARKHKLNKKSKLVRIISYSLIGVISLSTCIYGYVASVAYDYSNYVVETNLNNMKICVISDIHYGTTCSVLQKEKLIKRVNDCNADVLFLVGDIFDNHINDMDKHDFTSFIDSFHTTYGTYAVLGNHELKQNTYSDAISFYSDSSCKLLLDEEVIIGNKLRVVGRIDLQNKNRKDLKDIVSNSTLPLIVLDHQTDKFLEAKSIGAAIQYSGHTHNGQIFPYNLCIEAYFRLIKHTPVNGINKYDNFYLIICRGTSNWGFPYKTTGSSEIIITQEK